MAITAGQFLLQAGTLFISRIQTGGVTNLGIPNDKVYEAGNYETLATIRDTADLSFTLESLDCSIAGEALMLGPYGIGGAAFADLTLCQPVAMNGSFRSSQNHFDNIRGVIVPHLSLESVTYKFGLKANASQTFTLKGDSVYFIPGNPYQDLIISDGTSLTYALVNTALPYVNSDLDLTQYVVNMDVYNPDGTFERLFNGTNFDYTDTATSFTFNSSDLVPPAGAVINVQYGSVAAQSIAQEEQGFPDITVDPAAVRSRDIDVYVGSTDTPPVFSRWSGVQSFDCTWKVDLDPNAEFGNALNVSSDFVVPDVSGTITTKDVSVTELYSKIAQATNIPANQVAGTLSSTPIPIEIRISNPYDGSPLKTLYIPDARFEPPSMQGKVNAKLETPFKFSSDTGLFYVYPGLRPPPASTPIIISISPTSMVQGATGDIVFTGTGFLPGVSADIDLEGITDNSTTYDSSTQLTLNVTIADDAPPTTGNADVDNGDGGFYTLPDVFTVEAAISTPTFTSLNPNTVSQRDNDGPGFVNGDDGLGVFGTGFVDGVTVTFSGDGLVVSSMTFFSSTEVHFLIAVANDAATTVRDMTITNPDGGSVTVPGVLTVAFRSVPTITSVSPSSMTQGTTGDVIVTGTGFLVGANADIDDNFTLGVLSNSCTFDSSTQITVNITTGTTLGSTDAAVSNTDGGHFDLPDCFTVTA